MEEGIISGFAKSINLETEVCQVGFWKIREKKHESFTTVL